MGGNQNISLELKGIIISFHLRGVLIRLMISFTPERIWNDDLGARGILILHLISFTPEGNGPRSYYSRLLPIIDIDRLHHSR